MHYQWQGIALSASEKRYADGSPALREQWHYRGDFDLLAKEARAANDERSDFYPIVSGPDGAPQEMYSANGRKVWTRQRSLWGRVAANDSPYNARESCDAGFMGQWQDDESGLWYNLHRYYDAGTGQYVSPDPIGLAGGLNLYQYAPNPLSWIDPLGLAKCHFSGERGRKKAAHDLQKNGYTIVAEEVTMNVNGSRIRADFVAVDGHENYHVFEAKHGNSGLTRNQGKSGVFDMNSPSNTTSDIGGGTITPSAGTKGKFKVATGNKEIGERIGERGSLHDSTFHVLTY